MQFYDRVNEINILQENEAMAQRTARFYDIAQNKL